MFGFTRSMLQRATVSTRRILGTIDNNRRSCKPMLCPSLTYSTVVHHEKPLMDGEFNARTAAEYLSNLNENQKKKLEIIKMEYEQMRVAGNKVPGVMKDEWWATLLQAKSISQRIKHLRYYASVYYRQKKREEKKLQKKLLIEKIDPQPKNNEPCIFFKHYHQTYFSQVYLSRLANSMLYGRPFIIDMSYESEMRKKETTSLIQQLLNGYGFNKSREEPYDLMFTNWNLDSYVKKQFDFLFRESTICNTLFAKTTQKSYLDLFPREKLVYLSPDADEVLKSDHPDNIYIMGAYVDTHTIRPLSRIKSDQENIRCARLPLDEHFLWQRGSKTLSCDCVMNIMFEFMDTNNWRKALRHLPARKIRSSPTTKFKVMVS